MDVTLASSELGFSSELLRFEYHQVVQVSGFWPESGPLSGGMPLEVRGSHFAVGEGASCRIRRDVSTADVVSSTLLRCLMPSVKQAGVASVEVSNNGLEYVLAATDFVYTEEIAVLDVSPSQGNRCKAGPWYM